MTGPPGLTVKAAAASLNAIATPGTSPTAIGRMAACCHAAGVWPCAAMRRNGAGSLRRDPQSLSDRAVVWWLARRAFEPPLSYPEIAAAFGLRSHSTVIGRVRWLAGLIREKSARPVVGRAQSALVVLLASQGAVPPPKVGLVPGGP